MTILQLRPLTTHGPLRVLSMIDDVCTLALGSSLPKQRSAGVHAHLVFSPVSGTQTTHCWHGARQTGGSQRSWQAGSQVPPQHHPPQFSLTLVSVSWMSMAKPVSRNESGCPAPGHHHQWPAPLPGLCLGLVGLGEVAEWLGMRVCTSRYLLRVRTPATVGKEEKPGEKKRALTSYVGSDIDTCCPRSGRISRAPMSMGKMGTTIGPCGLGEMRI